MRADAALRISKLKGIKMRAKQRMRCFNASIAKKKVDQKSDASFDQPKAIQGNVESLTLRVQSMPSSILGPLACCTNY